MSSGRGPILPLHLPPFVTDFQPWKFALILNKLSLSRMGKQSILSLHQNIWFLVTIITISIDKLLGTKLTFPNHTFRTSDLQKLWSTNNFVTIRISCYPINGSNQCPIRYSCINHSRIQKKDQAQLESY